MAIFIIVLISLFILFFITTTVIIYLRQVKASKSMELASNQKKLEAVISKKDVDQNNIILTVDFTSPTSRVNFNKKFVLSKKQYQEDAYQEGQKVSLVCPVIDEDKTKKVMVFPLLLEGQKQPANLQFLLGSAALIVATIALLAFTLNGFIKNAMFGKSVKEVWDYLISANQFLVLIVIMGFFIATQAMLTILLYPSRDALYDYLKVYGVKATARVKTYKYGRAKSGSNKECHLEIEFTTYKGEKVNTRLSSFLYYQTQEEYIDILYAPTEPKNVVYLRK